MLYNRTGFYALSNLSCHILNSPPSHCIIINPHKTLVELGIKQVSPLMLPNQLQRLGIGETIPEKEHGAFPHIFSFPHSVLY